MNTVGVNRCRPGYGASCALCCGSHNYVLGPEEIGELFAERGRAGPGYDLKHPYEATSRKLFEDSMQCPHVGITAGDEIGCLIYDEHEAGGELGSFFRGTCGNFFCPAWENLTDAQVIFAARLFGDWYFYSFFINDIEAVQAICAQYGRPEDVPHDELVKLKEEIVERFIDEDGK